MCGIAGFIDRRMQGQLEPVALKMAAAIRHRGPDAQGVWSDIDQGVALSHARLAIQDLSPQGSQPMNSPSGRYIIVFNGEIYNFKEIRSQLQGSGYHFRGGSDTEVLIAAIEKWGISKALAECVGMFALAVWDKSEHKIHLARDRMGEKPLFYGLSNGRFFFASELKALRAFPGFDVNVDRVALTHLLRYSQIVAPNSIYESIWKLLPGTLLTYQTGWSEPRIEQYWSMAEAISQGTANSYSGSAEQATEELEGLLRSVVSRQMVADVPLGAFLSGGYDSSMVVALMQALSMDKVKTFSIGFDEHGFNEAEHAKAVAGHLGAEHTELYVSPQQAMEVIPKLPQIYDEPLAHPSQIPIVLLAELTKKHVTVALSGDGGDEVFAGYNRYAFANSVWPKATKLPLAIRKLLSAAIMSASPQAWSRAVEFAGPLLPASFRHSNMGDKLYKIAAAIPFQRPRDLYDSIVSHWKNPEEVVRAELDSEITRFRDSRMPEGLGVAEQMMYLDSISYLPDGVLPKVDRAAMHVSLETRIPFLDHQVVEFAWRLPMDLKMVGGRGKWLLRELLYKYVPRQLMERPKAGFDVPIDSWLRGPLRDWAESLLAQERLEQEGIFHAAPIRKMWDQHQSGRYNWQQQLWNVLMFQAWYEDAKSI